MRRNALIEQDCQASDDDDEEAAEDELGILDADLDEHVHDDGNAEEDHEENIEIICECFWIGKGLLDCVALLESRHVIRRSIVGREGPEHTGRGVLRQGC